MFVDKLDEVTGILRHVHKRNGLTQKGVKTYFFKAVDLQSGLGDKLAILRLAGICGRERNALVISLDYNARRIGRRDQVFNRIHVDDPARPADDCDRYDKSGTWNIRDDEPAPPRGIIFLCNTSLTGIWPTVKEDFESAETKWIPYATNKVIKNTRMKSQLGVKLT